MRKTYFTVALALLLLASMAVAGCGGSDKAGNNSSTKEVSKADLGVPIYPGASKQKVTNDMFVPGPGASAPQPPGNESNTNGQGSMPGPGASMPQAQGSQPLPDGRGPGQSMTTLWTTDSTSKVIAWYKERLSGKSGFQEVTTPNVGGSGQDGSGVMYTFKSGDVTKTVMIREGKTDSKQGTIISIGDAPQGMPSMPPGGQSL